MANPESEITLSSKLVSIEMLGSVIVTTVLICGVWWGLSSKVQANEEVLTKLEDTVATQQVDIAEIKTQVAVILERQMAADRRMQARERADERHQTELKVQLSNILRKVTREGSQF